MPNSQIQDHGPRSLQKCFMTDLILLPLSLFPKTKEDSLKLGKSHIVFELLLRLSTCMTKKCFGGNLALKIDIERLLILILLFADCITFDIDSTFCKWIKISLIFFKAFFFGE
jgi:hypothetical protein